MKTALGDEYDKVETTIKETLEWIEKGEHTKEEYEAKQKEVEGTLMPIIQKEYQSGMPAGDMPAGGMPAGMPTDESSATEVD